MLWSIIRMTATTIPSSQGHMEEEARAVSATRLLLRAKTMQANYDDDEEAESSSQLFYG